MKTKVLAGCVTMAIAAMASQAGAQDSASAAPVDPAIFPAPEKGMVRHVLTLPAAEHEGNMMAQIVVARTMEVDCNQVMIGADLESETLEGWGYNYFVVENVSQPASTLMGCPDDSRSEKLVSLNLGSEAYQRYNSKLPLVIYAPEGLSVGYRLWQTDGKLHEGSAE